MVKPSGDVAARDPKLVDPYADVTKHLFFIRRNVYCPFTFFMDNVIEEDIIVAECNKTWRQPAIVIIGWVEAGLKQREDFLRLQAQLTKQHIPRVLNYRDIALSNVFVREFIQSPTAMVGRRLYKTDADKAIWERLPKHRSPEEIANVYMTHYAGSQYTLNAHITTLWLAGMEIDLISRALRLDINVVPNIIVQGLEEMERFIAFDWWAGGKSLTEMLRAYSLNTASVTQVLKKAYETNWRKIPKAKSLRACVWPPYMVSTWQQIQEAVTVPSTDVFFHRFIADPQVPYKRD